MTARRFYITTPIYYINGAPHLGHAYTTVACDVLARWHRLRGEDVRYLTGTDEHGQKALKSATAEGITPREFADRIVLKYHQAWKALGISHDDFIRTTEERHRAGAQELWRRIEAAGDLYKKDYEGLYCVPCESFYLESQLVDGKCPTHHVPVESVKEESWFFRLSKYQQPLLDFYESRKSFVTPATRMNEVVSFVEMGLQDLSVSRLIPWGIPVPGDEKHVMYVWLDALSNYITALGFGPGSERAFSPYWPADLHVVGKEIIRFHAVYWPAFLMSAGLEPPRQILSHGWLLKDDEKMSKTQGNLADPLKLEQWFGADAVRYYLMREFNLGSDGNYSEEAILDRVNTDLANDLGNTLSRITRILTSDLGGRVPRVAHGTALREHAERAWARATDAMERHDVQEALKATWELLSATNKFLVSEEPWKLAKDPGKRAHLEAVMHDASEAMRHVGNLVAAVMPGAAREIWRRLGIDGDPFSRALADGKGAIEWGFPEAGDAIHESGMFPRLDKSAFFADVQQDAAGQTAVDRESSKAAQASASAGAAAVHSGASAGKGVIQYDDFAKVALIAAKITGAKKHPQADKLLVLDVDDGTGAPRTICAGMAEWYAPEELVGKTVAIVANLAARRLRGIDSQGMVLAASWTGTDGKERVQVVVLPDSVPAGAIVR